MAKLIPCPLCNSPKHSKMFNLNEDRTIVKCKECSIVYSNPMPEKEEIRAFYNAEYFIIKEKKIMDIEII